MGGAADNNPILMTLHVIVFAIVVFLFGQAARIPTGPLTFGFFTGSFETDGNFVIRGRGWPDLVGNWKVDGTEIQLTMAQAPADCRGAGRYTFRTDGIHLSLDLVSDNCTPRRMILARSTWRPVGEPEPIPERHIVRTAGERRSP